MVPSKYGEGWFWVRDLASLGMRIVYSGWCRVPRKGQERRPVKGSQTLQEAPGSPIYPTPVPGGGGSKRRVRRKKV